MTVSDNFALIQRYLVAFNACDMDGMMTVIHPDIRFMQVAGGEVNATVQGAGPFRTMADASRQLFMSRKQTVSRSWSDDEQIIVERSFEGVLHADSPRGLKAGETVRQKGRTEFSFRDGKISSIIDVD